MPQWICLHCKVIPGGLSEAQTSKSEFLMMFLKKIKEGLFHRSRKLSSWALSSLLHHCQGNKKTKILSTLHEAILSGSGFSSSPLHSWAEECQVLPLRLYVNSISMPNRWEDWSSLRIRNCHKILLLEICRIWTQKKALTLPLIHTISQEPEIIIYIKNLSWF